MLSCVCFKCRKSHKHHFKCTFFLIYIYFIFFLFFCSEGFVGETAILTREVSRAAYANMYGPTTGDKIRLGDTDLYAEIERDFAVYGDECIFGGGKVLRDGMGQAAGHPASLSLDTVITNAVIIDYTGIYKADIGIKDGVIVCTDKAGNPDMMDGVNKKMIVGVISSF